MNHDIKRHSISALHGRKYLLLLIMGICALSSCMTEDLDDCPDNGPGVILTYRYDLNMDYTDRFAQKVENLQAFIFDKQGILQDTLTPFVGKGMIAPNWERKVALAPGSYSILTWAGNDHFYRDYYLTSTNNDNSQSAPRIVIGETKIEEIRLFLKTHAVSDAAIPGIKAPNELEIKDLYHGLVKNIEVPQEGYVAVNTPLTKNTNTINVRIDGLSNLNEGISPTDFEISITGSNGHYKHNNTIAEESASLNYTAYHNQLIEEEFISNIRILRLMKLTPDEFSNGVNLLNITYKPTGLKICENVNLVDLILSSKIPARDSKGELILDSNGDVTMVSPTYEYLDRQDAFDITYEISKKPDNGDLIFTVYVNGWKITNIYPVS